MRSFLICGLKLLALSLFPFTILSLLSCNPPEPIRIGFVGGTSGSVADLGSIGRDGVQLAVEIKNKEGGIRGRPVELLIKNDEQNPEVARKVVRELIAEGASAIVGPMTSAMGLAVVPIVNQHKVLMVAPTVTTQALSGIDDFFFRVTSTAQLFASKNAVYQLKQNRMHRVAAAYDVGNRSFSVNWLENFEKTLVAGDGEIVARIEFNSGTDILYMDLARRMLDSDPDGVLVIANSVDSALLCQQIRKLDASVPITLSDWGASERLMELGGQAVEGVTVIQTFDRNSTTPRYLEFRKAYFNRYNREPGFAGVHAFDAANVVMEALEKRKEGQSLKAAVLSIREFDGLQSSFRIDDFGDVQRSHASISVVRDGRFVVLE
jgi:branched-chain amino acid transport system substrate-binding protein